MAETAKAGVAVDDPDLLTNNNVPEDGKEGKDSRKSGLSVDDKKRNVINFESIRQVSDSSTASVRVSDYNNFMTTIDQFLNAR